MRRSSVLLTLLAVSLSATLAPARAEEPAGDKGIAVVVQHAENWLKGRRHALIVGISDYQNLGARNDDPQGKAAAYDLDYADDDALAIEQFLKDELKYDNVYCLTDRQATRERILEEFGKLITGAKPFDTVFVYLSGHGFKRGKKTLFMPWDGKIGSSLGHKGIDIKEVFSDELRDCGADHKMLVLDCCHSGAATGKAARDALGLTPDELRNLSGRGLYILASCKKDEVAYEDEESKHGFFTRFFLEALREGRADKSRQGNKDDLVSADEIYFYLYEFLPEAVRKGKGGRQTPQREVPESGQTFIARVGRIPVTLRLKSIPSGALVLVNDKERGRTPADAPLKTSLELGVPQRVVATKEGFLPWERKLNPQRREPIELTAALTPEGGQQDTTYRLAMSQYKKGKVGTALGNLNFLIDERKSDAPKALCFLTEHYLREGNLKEAEARANELRRDPEYRVLDESAQADRALYGHASVTFDPVKPAERGLEWHHGLIRALKDFLARQPENRYAEEARRRIENSQKTITSLYLRAYNERVDRLLDDVRDELFDAAKARLAKAWELLEEARDAGYELELAENRAPESLATHIRDAERDHAERAAYRKALSDVEKAQDPPTIVTTWKQFLQAYPQGKFTREAGDFLDKAAARAEAWQQEQRDKAERMAFDRATGAAAKAKDPDEVVAVWQGLLKEWPEGKLAAQIRQNLEKAQQQARAWHEAEYGKALAEARKAKDGKDYGAARAAVARALQHKPNDPAALAFQKALVPVLIITTDPPGATVEVGPEPGVRNPQSGIRNPQSGVSPCQFEVVKDTTYAVRVSKKGYASSARTVSVGEGGEYRVTITLEESKLPAGLESAFEIPEGTKDAHGNPVRRGVDEKTGYPLEIRHKATGMHLVFIPAGEFMMGSKLSPKEVLSEYGGDKDWEKYFTCEHPQHKVRLSRPFYLGKYEVTVGQFKVFVEADKYRTEAETGDGAYGWSGGTWTKKKDFNWKNPGFQQTDDHPVVCVSWNDAQAFCRWAKLKLPTEAQWEYACRAGTTTTRFWGDEDKGAARYANVADEKAKRELNFKYWFKNEDDGYVYTAPAGRFLPNTWGLYDTIGNAWEWCQDWYAEDYYKNSPAADPGGAEKGSLRVLRGGSWYSIPRSVRAADRYWDSPGGRDGYSGFRGLLDF